MVFFISRLCIAEKSFEVVLATLFTDIDMKDQGNNAEDNGNDARPSQRVAEPRRQSKVQSQQPRNEGRQKWESGEKKLRRSHLPQQRLTKPPMIRAVHASGDPVQVNLRHHVDETWRAAGCHIE